MEKTILDVGGMSCGHCTKSVTEALQKLEGVGAVEADLATHKVTVEHEASVGLATLRQTIEDIGFDVVG